MVTPGEAWRALADSLGSRATRGKPLGPLTTYGVGGPAALYVEVDAPEDLDAVRSALRDTAAALGAPPAVFVLGRGSNLLVADEGFDGVVLHLGAGFAGVELPRPGSGSGLAEVGGGTAPAWCRPAQRWRSRCWLVAWPTGDGRDCRGPSACPGRSVVRCA